MKNELKNILKLINDVSDYGESLIEKSNYRTNSNLAIYHDYLKEMIKYCNNIDMDEFVRSKINELSAMLKFDISIEDNGERDSNYQMAKEYIIEINGLLSHLKFKIENPKFFEENRENRDGSGFLSIGNSVLSYAISLQVYRHRGLVHMAM